MEGVHINTSQNVTINYNLATVGSRIAARLLDGVFASVYIIIFVFIFMAFYNEYTEFWIYFFVFLALLPVLFYSLWMPYFMQGQTWGKKILKIKIVKIDGTEATFGTYFVRWLVNVVDTMFYSIVGLVVMSSTEKRQRVADLVAKTVVITIREQVHISQTLFSHIEENYTPVFSKVLQLSDKDMQIIKISLDRAKKTQDYELIKKLRNKIESVIYEYKPEISDMEYVDTILKDYQYFSQQ